MTTCPFNKITMLVTTHWPLTLPASLRLLTRFIVASMSLFCRTRLKSYQRTVGYLITIMPLLHQWARLAWYVGTVSMQAPALGKTINVFSPSAAHVAPSAFREEVSCYFQIDLKTVYLAMDTIFISPLILLLSQILLILFLR